MNRKAFLLGLYATGSQVLLLRELVSSLNGDELFIGTAFFGWLMAVAAGAYFGGKPRLMVGSGALFLCGVVLLPVALAATRLSPFLVSDVIGEIIPFSTAAVISIVVMLPVGIVSGWLFPCITREGRTPSASIVQVYLFEGIGAFVGGVMILTLVGGLISSLQMAVVLGIIVLAGYRFSYSNLSTATGVLAALVVVALLIAARYAVPHLDAYIDSAKYRSYTVEESFDTHYGHQTILSRDSTIVLLTDNTIEAVCPDLQAAENLLIPPLAYNPAAKEVLFIGRTEFGVAQLAEKLQSLSITALDPRHMLSDVLDNVLPLVGPAERIEDDPIAYCLSGYASRRYDIIVLNPDGLDNYKNSRLITGRFLTTVKSLLKDEGLVFLPTRYDTDRYITQEEKELLSMISNVFAGSFRHVQLWPGNTTLLFASDASLFDIPYDSIISRLASLEYAPRYISEDYLYDRLDAFKIERLQAAVSGSEKVNSMNRPLLAHYQAIYRAKAHEFDKAFISLILGRPVLSVTIPLLIVLFFAWSIISGKRENRFGLFLYFTAGLVSLSLELISFYVYQSSAGSLYSEMAVLIGAFMLGLALGVYYAMKKGQAGTGHTALVILLVLILLFLTTYNRVQPALLLFYHLFFLFAAAAATGGLFVAATNRYYPQGSEQNRGAGYACELVGSSVGALFTTTILLPVVGLHWLLISQAMLIAVALIGSFLTRPRV